MEWTASIGPALLTLLGVLLTLVTQVLLRSREERARAARVKETEWDLLHLSRRTWIDEAMEARKLARDLGATAEQLGGLPEDPWEMRGRP